MSDANERPEMDKVEEKDEDEDEEDEDDPGSGKYDFHLCRTVLFIQRRCGAGRR